MELLGSGVPGYRLINSCVDGRYRIVKTIIADPDRDVVLQGIRFEALRGSIADYRLHVLLAPHLGNQGRANNGWMGDYKGVRMLFAQRDAFVLALACSAGHERAAGTWASAMAGSSCGRTDAS